MSKIYLILDRFTEQAHWWIIGVFVFLGAKIMQTVGKVATFFGKKLAETIAEDILIRIIDKIMIKIQFLLNPLERDMKIIEEDIKKIKIDVKNKIDAKHKAECELAETREAIINFDEDRERFDLVRETLIKKKNGDNIRKH